MDLPQNNLPAPAANAVETEIEGLRQLLVFVLVLLLLVSGTLTVFVFRELNEATKDFEGLNAQFSQIQTQRQVMATVIGKLADYGKAHPDYVPILTKYHIAVNQTPVAPFSGGAAPAQPTGSGRK